MIHITFVSWGRSRQIDNFSEKTFGTDFYEWKYLPFLITLPYLHLPPKK